MCFFGTRVCPAGGPDWAKVSAAEMLVLCVFQVVNGPMDVVKSIDRMVTSLSPRLMAESDHVTIHSPNISESHTHTFNLTHLLTNKAEEFLYYVLTRCSWVRVHQTSSRVWAAKRAKQVMHHLNLKSL